VSTTVQRVVASESVVYAELGDEAVLLNIETGVYFGLDTIGNRIWKLLEGGAQVDDIVTSLVNEYEVQPAVARQDTRAFLARLLEKGLTVEIDG
jgi:hypothetical protein